MKNKLIQKISRGVDAQEDKVIDQIAHFLIAAAKGIIDKKED